MIQPIKTQYQQLAEYIIKNLAKGYTEDSLRYSLMSQGYSRATVERSIVLANKQLAQTAPKMNEKPQITYTVINEEELAKKVEANGPSVLSKVRNIFKK